MEKRRGGELPDEFISLRIPGIEASIIHPRNWTFDTGSKANSKEDGPEQYFIKPKLKSNEKDNTGFVLEVFRDNYTGSLDHQAMIEYEEEILRGKTWESDADSVVHISQYPFVSVRGTVEHSPVKINGVAHQGQWSLKQITINSETKTRYTLTFYTGFTRKKEFEEIAWTMINNTEFNPSI